MKVGSFISSKDLLLNERETEDLRRGIVEALNSAGLEFLDIKIEPVKYEGQYASAMTNVWITLFEKPATYMCKGLGRFYKIGRIGITFYSQIGWSTYDLKEANFPCDMHSYGAHFSIEGRMKSWGHKNLDIIEPSGKSYSYGTEIEDVTAGFAEYLKALNQMIRLKGYQTYLKKKDAQRKENAK